MSKKIQELTNLFDIAHVLFIILLKLYLQVVNMKMLDLSARGFKVDH